MKVRFFCHRPPVISDFPLDFVSQRQLNLIDLVQIPIGVLRQRPFSRRNPVDERIGDSRYLTLDVVRQLNDDLVVRPHLAGARARMTQRGVAPSYICLRSREISHSRSRPRDGITSPECWPVSKTGSLAHSGRDREAVARGPFGAPARVSERACFGNWPALR